MLQIPSGKLFKREPRQRNELRGVFYANLQSHCGNTIETKAGRIYSTTDIGGVQEFIYEITELIEDDPPSWWVGIIDRQAILRGFCDGNLVRNERNLCA